MASSLNPARRGSVSRRAVVTLIAAGALVAAPLLAPAPAAAEPTTSAEAATLVAERAHDLEVVTEQFNDARVELDTKQAEVDAATAQVAAAEAALAGARDRVREVARSAYTGDQLSTLQAMLTSESADELMDRVGTLDSIADHNNGILGEAVTADEQATEAKAAAEAAATEAQAQLDQVEAQRTDLNKQIAEYQALYERLSAAEQAASRAEAERRHAAEAAAAQQASGSGSGSRGGGSAARGAAPAAQAPSAPVVASSGAAGTAVSTAMAQQGKPYVWAAAGPGSFDCSGLVQYAYAAAGVSLPHSSRAQASMGRAVSRGELQPGDLIAFYSPVSHIGIYIGNGQMVHAPTSGDVVKVASIDVMGSITAMRRIAG
ncbi:C40 family peptidase [Modestobacter roseus]|uniref:Cell wall-associated NlpC family hydrolase n=1 Tax=Modestobacter roseus TaxID=1181884 RepID=A0A562IUI1_9ACTN|nr:C40 family peptidase [Modestobacter roseus]MQA32883.1 NlpC/P60 family protein [Modestobacter roseus]TWH74667.1 cell wall-associated NlpC family hydrolase [Modestobacter roseus]